MKKNIIYLFILAITLTSCSDFLNEEPILTQSNELTLSDYDGLNKATASAYNPLYSANWYGAAFILNSELRAGNAKNPTNPDFTSGRYTTAYHWNYTSSASSPIWNYAYFVISAANNVLNNLEEKEDPAKNVTAQDLNNLKAECLFLRALSYFDLVKTYAQPYTQAPESPGVPVVLVSEIGSPERNTVKEVYDQITTDLLEAEKAIGGDYVRQEITDKAAAVKKEVIQAFLSRVYLYMGDWQGAADYATKVINSGKYKMFTAADFLSQWGKNTAEEGGEIIFEIYGSQKNNYWGSWEDITWMTYPDGYADVASTEDLRSLYDENDVRGKAFISHNDAPDHFWTLKYPGKEGTNHKENNIVILRLSEMYLNRAEAIQNGASVSGVTVESDLLKITSNRNADPATATTTGIFVERRKELAFEGHIFFDYARTKRSLVRTDYDGSAVNKDIPFPSYKWALPIPKREMDANPNMTQNEGY